MKIKDEFVGDGNTVHRVRSYDFQPVIDDVRRIKNEAHNGDMWHVGRIPKELLGIWIKEAGLKWTDTEAVQDLVRQKLLSGEFNALRPDERSF